MGYCPVNDCLCGPILSGNFLESIKRCNNPTVLPGSLFVLHHPYTIPKSLTSWSFIWSVLMINQAPCILPPPGLARVPGKFDQPGVCCVTANILLKRPCRRSHGRLSLLTLRARSLSDLTRAVANLVGR